MQETLLDILILGLLVLLFASVYRTRRTPRLRYWIAGWFFILAHFALMLPTAYHRLRWRERSKERMLHFSHFGAVGGMVCLAIAMTATTFLVIDTVVSTDWAIVVAIAAGAAFGLVWFALPLSTPYDRWDADVETRPRDTRRD